MRTVKNIDIKVLTKAPVMEIEGVQYHHHLNGGGLVAETAQVEDSVYIGPCAKVCGHCKVSGDVLIFGHAWLSGTAEVSGRAQIFGNARVCDNASIRDDAKVYG